MLKSHVSNEIPTNLPEEPDEGSARLIHVPKIEPDPQYENHTKTLKVQPFDTLVTSDDPTIQEYINRGIITASTPMGKLLRILEAMKNYKDATSRKLYIDQLLKDEN